jgi:hypothetical protein
LSDQPTRADRRWCVEQAVDAGASAQPYLVISPLLLSQARLQQLLDGERRIALDLMREGIPL